MTGIWEEEFVNEQTAAGHAGTYIENRPSLIPRLSFLFFSSGPCVAALQLKSSVFVLFCFVVVVLLSTLFIFTFIKETDLPFLSRFGDRPACSPFEVSKGLCYLY